MTTNTRRDREPARTIAEVIAGGGAEFAFGVPGGGPNLDLVGELTSAGVRFVLAHGETASCIMAATYGHLAGSVSCAVVTRGPGAATAVNGAAQATLDRNPLVLVTDAVAEVDAGRVGHQQIDQVAMLAPVCKATMRVGADIEAQLLRTAFAIATGEPAGCLHLDYDAGVESTSPVETTLRPPALAPITATELAVHVAEARRPIVIVGRGTEPAEADRIVDILERFAAPVFTTYQAAGIVPSEHPLAAGLFTNAASERPLLEQADLIITVGLDPVEPVPAPWIYDAPTVSIASTPTRNPYVPAVGERIGPIAEIMNDALSGDHDWDPIAGAAHREHMRAALREHGAPLGPIEVVDAISAVRPPELTATVDAGAHFLAVMPFWATPGPSRLLISNGLATMGYAVPAAIGAALARPGQPVLAFVGDGGLAMTLAELETISRLRLPITTLVFNDSALSLIAMKQRDDHGGRDAVGYDPIDFAASARGLGLDATVVTSPSELTDALAGDWMHARLIDARIDPTPYRHLIAVTRG